MFDPSADEPFRDPRRRPPALRSAVIRISEAARAVDGAGPRTLRPPPLGRAAGRRGGSRSRSPPRTLLVGNADDAAGIEIIGTTFRFTCDDARVVAVAGRDVSLATRTRLPGWTSVFVRAGQTVTVHAGERTRYAYLAVSGGIATPPLMGSRATYLPAGLGAPLRAGDALPLGDADAGAEDAARAYRADRV